jgi:4-amino-4-deoxy-L-arabinose transferase-like glycosyltransferase
MNRSSRKQDYWETNGVYIALALFVLSGFLFLFHLNQGAFLDYDEASYAEVIQDTEAAGSFLTLYHFKTPWIDKPPLYFWSAMATERLVSSKELAYRLPSALSGIASIVLVVVLILFLTENYVAACLGGLILLTSPPFFEAGRQVRLDVPVTAAILFSVYCFLRGLKESRWYIGVGIGIAIGVLTKSVIGLLPGLFILLWALINWDFSWLKSKHFWIGLGLMLLIALPWHVYEAAQFGSTFWDTYIVHLVANRVETNILGGVSASSNQTYSNFLSTVALPWSAVFILAIGALVWRYRMKSSRKEPLAFALFCICVVGLFAMSGTKLAYYLTPIYPFAAIFIALVVHEFYTWARNKKALRVALLSFVVASIGAGVVNTIYFGYNYQIDFWKNQVISNEEKDIGLMLAQTPTPSAVYTYQYQYLDTIRYYGNGRGLQAMTDNQILDHSFFLVMSRYVDASNTFDPELQKHLTLLYKGQAVVLYKFAY